MSSNLEPPDSLLETNLFQNTEPNLFDLSSLDHHRLSVSEFNDGVDFDKDVVNSPGASSTSSEPVYIRQPGFEHHAHEFKANASHEHREIFKDKKPPPHLQKLTHNKSPHQEAVLAAYKERSSTPFHSNYFPPPPLTPVTSFSPLRSSSILEHQSITQALKSTPENIPKLFNPIPPLSKSCSSASLESITDAPKSRTGNHTPPGCPSSKGTKKKKPNSSLDPSEGSREGTPEYSRPSVKSKIKREPLPMKMRALPQSFWLQPNRNNNVPPSCSVLPPLILGKDLTEVIDMQPIFPLASSSTSSKETPKLDREERSSSDRVIKVGNTDLLFRLFDKVEKDDKKKAQVVRRGRPPRKSVLNMSSSKGGRDDDPCLVSTAAESILPLLPDRTPASSGSSTPLGNQVLELINLREGDRTVSLPSLNADHGYSQLLSELVLQL